ncbi:MAG: HlyD family efflux transporter periplasmic adaptor subunit [Phycisphaerales bacterium]|nr:MAG: HlyD family efflux transporter periplasmic adaptor subunit [Phycisphaerales bacterium]
MKHTPILSAVRLLLTATAVGVPSADPPDRVGQASASTSTRPGEDRIAAILTPHRQATLSAEISGRVTAINKELGERFNASEVLLELDDATFRANRRIAEAMLTSAKVNLTRVNELAKSRTRQRHSEAVLAAANANLTATQRLYADSNASLVDLENAKRDAVIAQTNCELVGSTASKELADAQREMEIAAGKLEIAARQLEACSIIVPWAGRVARVLVNEHELVQHGTPVIEVIDDRVLLAKFLLPSSAFKAVRLGQELDLHVTETSDIVQVKISHVAAALDPASVTFEVHAEVDNADGKLRAGMNGTLSLTQVRGP